MTASYLTAPLETLTLTQLFARQAQVNSDHERALAARNQHTTISAEWDLWNAVLTGYMIDLADIAAAVTKRIAGMAAEAASDSHPLTHVDMVCTACRKPVFEVPGTSNPARGWVGTQWAHDLVQDARACPASGSDVKAMVAAGNESVPRNA